jgi:hypothetical protein
VNHLPDDSQAKQKTAVFKDFPRDIFKSHKDKRLPEWEGV